MTTRLEPRFTAKIREDVTLLKQAGCFYAGPRSDGHHEFQSPDGRSIVLAETPGPYSGQHKRVLDFIGYRRGKRDTHAAKRRAFATRTRVEAQRDRQLRDQERARQDQLAQRQRERAELQLQRWPWPLKQTAELLARLSLLGVTRDQATRYLDHLSVCQVGDVLTYTRPMAGEDLMQDVSRVHAGYRYGRLA